MPPMPPFRHFAASYAIDFHFIILLPLI